jgi:DNA-binding MarR family transcriptional regulator
MRATRRASARQATPSGTSMTRAAPSGRASPVADEAVVMSNHASTKSSVAAAVAAGSSQPERRQTQAARVTSIATSATSSPTQAAAQLVTRWAAGSALTSSTTQGTSATAATAKRGATQRGGDQPPGPTAGSFTWPIIGSEYYDTPIGGNRTETAAVDRAAQRLVAADGAPEDPTAIVARSVEDLILLVYRRGGQVDGPATDALTSTQRLVLVLLADHAPVRLGALARLAETTEATATRTVTGLARLGLAERGRDPADGRAVLVALTAAGRELVEGRRHTLRASLESGMSELGDRDGRRLAELMSRVVRTVRTLPDRPPA